MRVETILSLLAASQLALAADDRPPFQNTSAVPVHYGFLLIPSLTPIDMFGPMDVFTGLSMYYTNSTGKMHMSILSVNSTPATTTPPMNGLTFGMDLPPSITFDEYQKLVANNFSEGKGAEKGPLDVILVPGGGGARMDVTHEIAFLKTLYPSLKYAISVCTGSTLLARAGILDNRRATTNKKAWTWASSFGNNVSYQPRARWVKDGNVYTGSGVSAAIDTAYGFVADVYGDKVAQWVADASEYTRWTNASYDPFAERWGVVNGTA